MTRPAKASSEAVADGLVAAFRRGGYSGASLRDLKDATGLNPASLYHRFPEGKADMAMAALEHAETRFAELVLAPLSGNTEPSACLRNSANGVAEFYEDGGLPCLLAILTLSQAPPAVHAKVGRMFTAWQLALAQTLIAVGNRQPEDDAADRIAAVQGALILNRSGANPECFARAVERLAAV